MGEPRGATQSRKISFSSHQETANQSNRKLEKKRMRDHELLRMKEKSSSSSNYRSLEIPKGPIHAMEFLSRSWSPSASHFLQIFPPSSLLLPLRDRNKMENQEEKQEVEDITQSDNRIKSILGWLRSKIITSLFDKHKANKKDEVRFHTAQVHAALSVAQLAAAIAGFAANSSTGAAQGNNIEWTNGGLATWDKDMGAVASAAALVATVCAEAAESVGARRAHIASAVSSGLASQSSIDMMALTATAATCLRGAARLKSRATADTYTLRSQKMLKVGVQLSIIMPSGHKEHQWVSIYLKHKQLLLRLRKKHLKGLIPTSKQYKIIHAMDKSEEAQGIYLIKLKINNGDIKLLFEDKKQSSVWISTISNLLQMHNTY